MRRSYGPGGTIVTDKCDCGLTLNPPLDQDYWWPSLDQPDDNLHIIVRHTEHPTYRRAIRADGGWVERGCSVEGTGTAGLIPWERIGLCWAGTEHPVVAANHD
jgi:hypothetical protein